MLIYTLYPRQNQKEKLFLLHCTGSGPEHHTIELGPRRGISGAADLSLSEEGPVLQPGNQHKTSTQPEDGLAHFSHVSLLQLLALSAALEKNEAFLLRRAVFPNNLMIYKNHTTNVIGLMGKKWG